MAFCLPNGPSLTAAHVLQAAMQHCLYNNSCSGVSKDGAGGIGDFYNNKLAHGTGVALSKGTAVGSYSGLGLGGGCLSSTSSSATTPSSTCRSATTTARPCDTPVALSSLRSSPEPPQQLLLGQQQQHHHEPHHYQHPPPFQRQQLQVCLRPFLQVGQHPHPHLHPPHPPQLVLQHLESQPGWCSAVKQQQQQQQPLAQQQLLQQHQPDCLQSCYGQHDPHHLPIRLRPHDQGLHEVQPFAPQDVWQQQQELHLLSQQAQLHLLEVQRSQQLQQQQQQPALLQQPEQLHLQPHSQQQEQLTLQRQHPPHHHLQQQQQQPHQLLPQPHQQQQQQKLLLRLQPYNAPSTPLQLLLKAPPPPPAAAALPSCQPRQPVLYPLLSLAPHTPLDRIAFSPPTRGLQKPLKPLNLKRPRESQSPYQDEECGGSRYRSCRAFVRPTGHASAAGSSLLAPLAAAAGHIHPSMGAAAAAAIPTAAPNVTAVAVPSSSLIQGLLRHGSGSSFGVAMCFDRNGATSVGVTARQSLSTAPMTAGFSNSVGFGSNGAPSFLASRPINTILPPSLPHPLLAPLPSESAQALAEGFILHAAQALRLDLNTSAKLALHVWRRISGMVRLLLSIRRPVACYAIAPLNTTGCSSGNAAHPIAAAALTVQNDPWVATIATNRIYAAACLWLGAKLEGQRLEVPGAGLMAALAQTTAGAISAVELRVLEWVNWNPSQGYLP